MRVVRRTEPAGLAEVEVAARVLEQPVVHGHRVGAPRAVAGTPSCPGCAATAPGEGRRGRRPGPGSRVERVARVEERRLALGVEADPDVGDARDLVVDEGVLLRRTASP